MSKKKDWFLSIQGGKAALGSSVRLARGQVLKNLSKNEAFEEAAKIALREIDIEGILCNISEELYVLKENPEEIDEADAEIELYELADANPVSVPLKPLVDKAYSDEMERRRVHEEQTKQNEIRQLKRLRAKYPNV